MRLIICLLAAALALLLPAAAASAQEESPYRALQKLDARLAGIGYRLTTANAPLCEKLDAATGIHWHDVAQYGDRAAIADIFAFETPIEAEAVVPGSPAAIAGVQPGDALVAIDFGARITVDDLGRDTAGDRYLRVRRTGDAIAGAAYAPAIVTLELLRAGAPITLALTPLPACASRFQLRIEDGLKAGADGVMVSVNLPLMQYALADGEDEGALAAVVAHELAHNILRHKERLEAVDVDRGIARLFGKNARRIKATEEEADRLSVWLMANAGYDPEDAVRFWTRFGKEHGLGIFTEGTHYQWKNRVAQIREEMAALNAIGPQETLRRPPILAAPLPSLE